MTLERHQGLKLEKLSSTVCGKYSQQDRYKMTLQRHIPTTSVGPFYVVVVEHMALIQTIIGAPKRRRAHLRKKPTTQSRPTNKPPDPHDRT